MSSRAKLKGQNTEFDMMSRKYGVFNFSSSYQDTRAHLFHVCTLVCFGGLALSVPNVLSPPTFTPEGQITLLAALRGVIGSLHICHQHKQISVSGWDKVSCRAPAEYPIERPVCCWRALEELLSITEDKMVVDQQRDFMFEVIKSPCKGFVPYISIC